MQLVRDVKPRFAFQDDTRFAKWKPQLRDELLRILAVGHDPRAPLKSSVTRERSTEDCDDYLATMKGVREAFAQTKRIFTVSGCPDHAELLVGDAGHQFYPELAWPRIQKVLDGWGAEVE